MIVCVAGVIFITLIVIKSVITFKKDKFYCNRPENYRINPLYVNTDIPIEEALKDFKIIEFARGNK